MGGWVVVGGGRYVMCYGCFVVEVVVVVGL